MRQLTQRVPLAEVGSHVGEEVLVSGFVSVVRKQKAVQFVILRDGLFELQIANPREANSELAELIDSLKPESVISAEGTIVADQRIKLRGIELRAKSLSILSSAEDLPIGKDANLDLRLDWRWIDLRTPQNQALMSIQSHVSGSFRDYCRSRGMVEIHSPKLMDSPSESRSELFEVPYFGRTAYLAQSPQFFKQMGIAAGLPGVFEVGPVFRANPSFTSRHDTEFTSLDIEIPWVDSHEDVMRFEEGLLVHVLSALRAEYAALFDELFGIDVVVPETPFPRISHADAIAIVEESGYSPTREDGDLDPEAERRLGSIIAHEHGHQFVFVTDYPTTVRPFYHHRHSDNATLTRSYDLLWKGLEITTGAQREHRVDVLEAQVRDKGLDPEALTHYLEFFRYGCPPHGGFGLGLTRLLMVLLNRANVREVTYLYRGPNRLAP